MKFLYQLLRLVAIYLTFTFSHCFIF